MIDGGSDFSSFQLSLDPCLSLPPDAASLKSGAAISVVIFDISLSGDSDEFFHPDSASSATRIFADSRFQDVDAFLKVAKKFLDHIVDQYQVWLTCSASAFSSVGFNPHSSPLSEAH